MKVFEMRQLMKKHGDLKLSELIEKTGKFFECPKCKGKGSNQVTYNAYPSGLPDSGWVQDMQTKNVHCEICDGHGYTEKELKPKIKTEIIGYE